MLIPCSKWERQCKKEFQQHHTPLQNVVEQGQEKGYNFDDFTQDLFSALYQSRPEFPEQVSSGAAWAKRALDELRSLQDYKEIRNQGTVCDSLQSGLGATILAEHFVDSLQPVEEPNPDKLQEMIDNLKDLQQEHSSEKLQQRLEKLQQQLPGSEKAWTEVAQRMDGAQIRQVFRRAIAALKKESAEMENAAVAFGFGKEPGQDGYTNPKAKMEIANMVRENPKLRRLAEIAGRFRREARKVQANKKQPGPDELTDIEIGNDLGRLLPAEIMKLADPLFELDFMKKYLEGNLIQYKLETVEKEQKGPIVVCIDNSGSMSGEREIWSKAIALAMCQIAADQKRDFEIIHFDTEVKRIDQFSYKEGIDPERLLESMAFFSGGGTDFVQPLNKAINDIGTEIKKADIIFITDGFCTIDENASNDINRNLKENGISLYSMFISMKEENDLSRLSNESLFIEDLEDESWKDTIFSV